MVDFPATQDRDEAGARAAQGWSSLHGGAADQALTLFEESLRLDPRNPSAREGVVAAMRFRIVFLRPMLRYLLWLSRHSKAVRFAIVVGGYVLLRGALKIAEVNPSFSKWFFPLAALTFLFAFVHWGSDPIFNWLLLKDPRTRRLLTDVQVRDAHLVGVLLLFGLAIPVGFLAWLFGKAGFFAAAFLYLLLPILLIRKIQGARARLTPCIVLALAWLTCLAVFSAEWPRPRGTEPLTPGLGSFALAVVFSLATMLVANRARFPVRRRR